MPGDQVTILYIEDDAANRLLVRKLLRAEGYEVLEADNGVAGIDLALETGPDLILVDMNMPGLDGYETATRVKSTARLHDIPIVAVTANVLQGDRERSLIAGCEGYIAKPIDVDTFVNEVESYLRGKRERVAATEEGEYLKAYSSKLVERLEGKVRELTVALHEATEVSRLKTEFLATMSHELRTPLNSVIGFAELLEQGGLGPVNDEQSHAAHTIRTSGLALLDMINKILDYACLEASKVTLAAQPVVVRQVVDAVVARSRQAIQDKGLTLHYRVAAPDRVILADPGRLEQLVQILLDNALRFTEQGEIVVQVDEIPEQRLPAELGPQRHAGDDGQFTVITVSDTGCGMDDATMEVAFEAFRQADGSQTRLYEGIGLGLAIARRLVEMHGGTIVARSKPGKGSIFYVALPVRAVSAARHGSAAPDTAA